MIKIFIGRDPRKAIDYSVLATSIIDNASVPVSITALSLKTLPIKRRGLTEFTFSRFLVPYLCDYQGTALFLDADMVVTGDIAELFEYANTGSSYADPPPHPVYVNKNQKRFEWPSAMLFDCSMCQNLTPAFIDDPRNTMYDFAWAESIGGFPEEWNKAVGYTPVGSAKLYHYTMGTPVWKETRHMEPEPWFDAYKAMLKSCTFEELMGNSVHIEKMRAVSC